MPNRALALPRAVDRVGWPYGPVARVREVGRLLGCPSRGDEGLAGRRVRPAGSLLALERRGRRQLHRELQERHRTARDERERSRRVQVKRALLLLLASACGGIPQSKECEKYL